MQHNQPREFITYTGYIISYLVVAISFLSFSFAFINILYPEISGGMGYDSIYGSLGIFTTGVLVFLAMVWSIVKLNKQKLTSPESRVRIWMLQIGQFIGFLVLAITAAVLIRYFFSGEITARFLIKVGIVLVVGIDAVLFFRHELGRTDKTKPWVSLGACIGAVIVLIFSIVGTFSYLGTPNITRSINNDTQRISDLQSINGQITSWYQSHGTLPETLSVLKTVDYYTEPRDPQYLGGKTYTYNLINNKKLQYQVCGDFELATANKFVVRRERANYYTRFSGGSMPIDITMDKAIPVSSSTDLTNPWDYSAGKHCFDRVIDTKQNPVFKRE